MKSSRDTLRQKKVTTEGKIKLFFSLSLCIYAIVVSDIKSQPIAVAMIFSFFGDFFLMKKRDCFHNKEETDFTLGVFTFMLAHLCYHLNMLTIAQVPVIIIIAVVMIVYAALVVKFGVMKNIIIIGFYAIVLISSVVNTFFFNRVSFIGGIFFFISDSLIGLFMLLKKDSKLTQVAIWGTYVPAQILLLTSFLVS